MKVVWSTILFGAMPPGDNTDWIAYQGATPTEFTGPSGTRNGDGKYLYLESSGESCGTSATAILQSRCLAISGNLNGCDLSFWYHMYGSHTGQLSLEISADAGNSWSSLLTINGNQDDQWINTSVDLSAYHGQFAKLRFLATKGDGFLSDIAIDDIIIYGSNPVDSSDIRYYADLDQDDYGSMDSSACFCLLNPPDGFVDNALDCDDNDATISPGNSERPCNLVDDNCDGNVDEGVNPDPILYDVINRG